MYRNLLVHIPTERSPRPAIDGSISLAMTCGAHLDAIAVGYELTNNVPFVAEGGAAVAAVFELERERAMERANAALAVFEVEAKAAKIGYRMPRHDRQFRRSGRHCGRKCPTMPTHDRLAA